MMARQVALIVGLVGMLVALIFLLPVTLKLASPDVLTAVKEKLKPGDRIILPGNMDWKEQVLSVDLDGDEEQEGIALIQYSDKRLGVLVLKKIGFRWEVIMDVRKPASGIEHAYVGDYDGDKQPDLMIGWEYRKEKKLGPDHEAIIVAPDSSVKKTLELYQFTPKKVIRLAQKDYYMLQSDDFDQDGIMDIVELKEVPSPDPLIGAGKSYNLFLYKIKNDKLNKITQLKYPLGVIGNSIYQFEKGKINRKKKGIFLVYHTDGNFIVGREVFQVIDGEWVEFKDLLLNQTIRADIEIESNSTAPFRDINGDGFFDLPGSVTANIQGDDVANAFKRKFINWYQWKENDTFALIAQQYEDAHFLFNFPKRWFNQVKLNVDDWFSYIENDWSDYYLEGEDRYLIILRDKISKQPVIRIGQVTNSEWKEKEKELKERKLRYEVLFDEAGQVFYAVLPRPEEVEPYPTLKN